MAKLKHMLSLVALLLAVFVVSPHQSSAQTVQDLDKKYGFRDVHFGDQLNAIVGMQEYKHALSSQPHSAWKEYRRSTDNLQIGDVALDYLAYESFNERFYRVTFVADAIHGYKLFEILSTVYGKPNGKIELSSGAEYYWRGDKVEMIMSETAPQKVHVFITSLSIQEELQKHLQAERLKSLQNEL